jgi:acetoin utilization protein AcuC
MHQPIETLDIRPGATLLVSGPEIAAYGFGHGHPFGPDRHEAFMTAARAASLLEQVAHLQPRRASREELMLFHTGAYVDLVERLSQTGTGYLDGGDTPVVPGIFEAACWVVGATLRAVEQVMATGGRAFVPIAGLHHASRGSAAGFCVFNDCAVAAAMLRSRYGLARIAYVDIDAHHGDGVFYGFEDDPDMLFADTHEDGRYLYPGTGARIETGRGAAAGTKLNLPLPPGAGDAEFLAAWQEIEAYLEAARPEFILLQCGADSLAGDPITHLQFSEQAHAHAAARLCVLADRHAEGRLVAMGGGGYNRDNLGRAWSAVLAAFIAHGRGEPGD